MGVTAPEPDVTEVPASALVLAGDAEIDIQVTTARAYPRSVRAFIDRATEMATLTKEIAASCIYALPRKEDGADKMIEGPSARLAEIVANAWKNCRYEGRVIAEDDRFVTARGTFWDIEANAAVAYEVRRRITGRGGRRYSDDMIGVTGNAAASIAIRNAVFKGVPSPFWLPIYRAVRATIAGEAKTFSDRRAAMLHEFGIVGVTKDQVAARVGLKGWQDITLDHMVALTGLLNAIKDNEISVDEAFDLHPSRVPPKPGERLAPSVPPGGNSASAPAEPVSTTHVQPAGPVQPPADTVPAPPASSDIPRQIGYVQAVSQRGTAWIIELTTGFRCATLSKELATSLIAAASEQLRVELITRAARTPGNAPVLEEIIPMQERAGS